MEQEDIFCRLRLGIEVLNEADRSLLTRDVHEQSVGARLAYHLQALFPDHDVDVEYNRHEADPKRLEIDPKCANKTNDEGETLVRPDVIVHQRGHDFSNLLVLEIKKEGNDEGTDCDVQRIMAFVQDETFDYTCGAVVQYRAGENTEGLQLTERFPRE